MDNTPVFADPQQQLRTVNDAIYNILVGGQSYQLAPKGSQERIWAYSTTCRLSFRRRLQTVSRAHYFRTRLLRYLMGGSR